VVVGLQAAISRFVAEANDDPKPFAWLADPNQEHPRRQARVPSVRFDPLDQAKAHVTSNGEAFTAVRTVTALLIRP
jgi:hypothetical protein